MEQILIVEDDIELGQGLCKALRTENRKTVFCPNLKAAKEQLSMGGVSLVLLDSNLPDGSGLTLLSEIKEKTPNIPVVMLTANDTDMDIVEGLERGADDYVTKPFSLRVLRARVNTQLRKKDELGKDSLIQIDHFAFDFIGIRFLVNGKMVELSKTEQRLLYQLVHNRGAVLRRSDLVDRIWKDGAAFVDENALSVTVKRLRDKLDAGDYIKTVYGVGYSWIVP